MTQDWDKVLRGVPYENAMPLLRVVYGIPARDIFTGPITDIIGTTDPSRMDDATLVRLAEKHIHELNPATYPEGWALGKVCVSRPEAGEGNYLIGPVPEFGDLPGDHLQDALDRIDELEDKMKQLDVNAELSAAIAKNTRIIVALTKEVQYVAEDLERRIRDLENAR